MVPSSAALGFLSLPLALLAFAPAGSPTSTAPAQERDQGKKERKEGEEKPEPTLKVGDAAPAIEVDKWVKGDAVSGFEKGKAYLVEFWATWCPPCRESIPHLSKVQKKFPKVIVLGIASSERGPKEGEPDKRLEGLESFVKDQKDKMEYRVAYDGKRAMAKSWMQAAGQDGIPCVFLVDREGKINWIGSPFEMDGAVKALAAAR